MRKSLLNIAFLSISLLVSIGAVKAQVTIFEQNGAQNEMDPSLWTVTADMGFSTNAQISIGSGQTGTLVLDDHQFYKDVTCEIFLNADLNTQFPITFNGFSGGELTQIFTYKQHNGDGINRLLFTFNSSSFSPTDLKEMVFTNNQNKVIKINHIKITGTITSASTDMEDAAIFDVTVNKESLIINSEIEGTLNVYNSVGQVEGTYPLSKGENTVLNSTKGMSFLVLTNSTTGVISRKKIMR